MTAPLWRTFGIQLSQLSNELAGLIAPLILENVMVTGSGLISVLIYASAGGILPQENAILTQSSNEILTENSNNIVTES